MVSDEKSISPFLLVSLSSFTDPTRLKKFTDVGARSMRLLDLSFMTCTWLPIKLRRSCIRAIGNPLDRRLIIPVVEIS